MVRIKYWFKLKISDLFHQDLYKILDKEQLCNEILKLDDKIRFAGIYDDLEFYHKMRDGLDSYLTLKETEDSLAQAIYRWKSRKKDGFKIGEPAYSMAKYGKVYRITMPIETAGLIIATLELTADVEEIAEKIIHLRHHNYQPS